MSEKKIMLGNEAIARGAYEAGVKVSAAYPGTPSTEISENIVKYPEIYAEWSPNEKVATEVAIGASISGVRAIVSMKHVGVNVASDPLYTISYAGVNGGLVLVAADDPGLYSSQNEQDSRAVARAAIVPVLEPSDSEEAKEFTKYAFELSEKYDTPVMVRTTTRLSHSQGTVELCDRQEIEDKPYTRNPAKFVMMPGNAKQRHLYVEERMKKTISVYEENLSEIRAGRANPAILNKITVDYYGVPTPINQVAGISVPEARMILIQPWDMNLLKEIEKEILKSDIGINPNNDGKVIRLNFPELNEERRKEIVKDIRKLAEEAKVAIRSIRRDAMDEAKEMQKKSEITEDDLKNEENEIQKLTDKKVEEIDSMLANKEREVMSI